ncbi:MAG: RidA family protein [Leptospiraceae bacterium]|nr:RidA family protein [Leptospiraceae bacterium]MDW7975250.1 RidA family protein [Leptospiraceae bacterium]
MIKSKLSELQIQLPSIPKPVASYIPAKIHNGLIYTSGQLPLKEGNLLSVGILDKEEDIEKGKKAMEQCFLNALAAASSVIDIDSIKGILKLTAYVASSPQFVWQHLVANGASDLAVKIFGENGIHARSAIGVCSLPLNASVELEVIFIL